MTDNNMPRTPLSRTFRLVMTPNRSLSQRGFLALMSIVGAISFIAGAVFVSMGAWPIMGFFGLDVLLIYVAFKRNYHSGRLMEVVEISESKVLLTRTHPDGREQYATLNPYWARVDLTEGHDGRTALSLCSHGRQIPVGVFLSDDERREVAAALTQGLAAVRIGN